MSFRTVIHVIALLLAFVAAALLLTAPVAFFCGDPPKVAVAFFACAVLIGAVSYAAFRLTRRRPGEPPLQSGIREGFASVGLGWLITSAAAALPLVIIVKMPFSDAIFEAASGLTTTGASVLGDGIRLWDGTMLVGAVLDGLPKGVLFWRAILNWLGGLGIVFFTMLILPLFNIGRNKMLYNAEVPGLKTAGDQLTPRLATSMKMMLAFYGGITLASILLYWALGMTFFDAVCHSFSTVSTGGFSPHAAGMAIYNDKPLILWAVIFFMFISACNFGLFLRALYTRRLSLWPDEEFRCFLLIAVFATAFIAILMGVHCPNGVRSLADGTIQRGVEPYLRTAAFHVVSLTSTTGFTTSDYTLWGVPAILLLLAILMIPCGCGGSTAGGMKVSRLLVMLKQLGNEIRHCLSPRALQEVRLNDERLDDATVSKTMAFAVMYIVILLAVAFLLSLFPGIDIGTALGSSLTCIGNVGPGFGATAPSASFATLPWIAKWILMLTMIIGRLELYTMLVLVFPTFWRR